MKKILLALSLLFSTSFLCAEIDFKALIKASKEGNYGTGVKLAKQYVKDEIASGGEDSLGASSAYGVLGNMQNGKGDYPEAIESFKKALDILNGAPVPKDKEGRIKRSGKLSLLHANISGSYSEIRDFDKALKHYNITLKDRLKPESRDHSKLWLAYLNIALIYRDKLEYKIAQEYFEKAQKTAPLEQQAIVILQRAATYDESKDYQSAIDQYTLCLDTVKNSIKILSDMEDPTPYKQMISDMKEAQADIQRGIDEVKIKMASNRKKS